MGVPLRVLRATPGHPTTCGCVQPVPREFIVYHTYPNPPIPREILFVLVRSSVLG